MGQALEWGTPSNFHADFINYSGTETQWITNSCGNAWLGIVVDLPYDGDFQLRLEAKVAASTADPNENWFQIGFVGETVWASGGDIPTLVNADLLSAEWQTLILDLPGLKTGRYIAVVKIGAICTKSAEALLRDMTVWD